MSKAEELALCRGMGLSEAETATVLNEAPVDSDSVHRADRRSAADELEELRKGLGATPEEFAEALKLAEEDLRGGPEPEREHRHAVKLARIAPAAGCVTRTGAAIQIQVVR